MHLAEEVPSGRGYFIGIPNLPCTIRRLTSSTFFSEIEANRTFVIWVELVKGTRQKMSSNVLQNATPIRFSSIGFLALPSASSADRNQYVVQRQAMIDGVTKIDRREVDGQGLVIGRSSLCKPGCVTCVTEQTLDQILIQKQTKSETNLI